MIKFDMNSEFESQLEVQLEKIAKDIEDRSDKEMAMQFTKTIGELLRKNGVTPIVYKSDATIERNNSIEKVYGVAVGGLDFTEHDKPFEDQIKDLRKKIRDQGAQINELKYELSKKCELETEDLVKLPFDALEAANVLINATYEDECLLTGRKQAKDLYSIDELEQIAEHLLVYCKHNKESEK